MTEGERAGAPGLPGGRLILFGIGAFFVAGLVFFLLGSRLAPRTARTPGFPVAETAVPAGSGTFRLTLDVRDKSHWVPVDLGLGRLVPTLEESDLAARRYLLRAPGGALDLGPVPLDAARIPENPEWVADRDVDGSPQNPVLCGWYRYSYWTHVLESEGHAYAVRRRDGSVAYLTIDSYYCEPEGSGCLTLTYRLE